MTASAVLTLIAVILFAFAALAVAHPFGIAVMLLVCLGLACFAAAHLPV